MSHTSWKKNSFLAIGALALIASKTTLANDSADEIAERIGSGNPVAGKVKSKSELCQGCHGEHGNSAAAEYPKLAGQYAEYISKQFRNFRSGERRHQIMNAMATTVDDADLSDIAAYFAGNNKMKGDGTGDSEIARRLFVKGDMKRNIMACISCHGEGGKGAFFGGETFPVIGGQHKFYLREQLLNWKTGMRTNSPGGVMNVIAKSLSEDEIEALSNYLAGQ